MKVIDLIKEEAIGLNQKVNSKEEALNRLVELAEKTGLLRSTVDFRAKVFQREREMSTGLTDGIAIPHGKSKDVISPFICCMTTNDIDFDSLDGAKTNVFFLIAVPDGENASHLEIISNLSTILMTSWFKDRILSLDEPGKVLLAFKETEDELSKDKALYKEEKDQRPFILAVTGCPLGISHTYIARDKLKEAAKSLDIGIKIETNGSDGILNKLTKEDIEKADAIVVCADKYIDTERFSGKKLINTGVQDGIYRAKEVLEKAVKGDIEIHHEEKVGIIEKTSLCQTLYKHLMNGLSFMLPFTVAGGILIALSFLFDDYSLNLNNYGSNNEFSALLREIGQAAFYFMLPILSSFIARSIGDRPGLALGFVGGYLANKGGAGFIGAIVSGFLAGFLALSLKKIFSLLPKSLEGLKPILIYPVIGIFIVGFVQLKIINPPLRYLNIAINQFFLNTNANHKLFLGFLVGGLMSIDFGGPINKASYLFATSTLVSGSSQIMAACMAGGMAGPLAVAISASFFSSVYDKKERYQAILNYVMAAAFIPEGVIAFAVKDPIRIIPSCVLASGLAGMLSIYFKASIRAAHGGVFVIALVKNPIMYLLSILIGGLVGGFLIGLTKSRNRKINH